jgi:hypothetical protein
MWKKEFAGATPFPTLKWSRSRGGSGLSPKVGLFTK